MHLFSQENMIHPGGGETKQNKSDINNKTIVSRETETETERGAQLVTVPFQRDNMEQTKCKHLGS